MGVKMCMNEDFDEAQFITTPLYQKLPENVHIPQSYLKIFKRIIYQFKLNNPFKLSKQFHLDWFESTKQHFFLFGKINKNKPIGECIFWFSYFYEQCINKKKILPCLIMTKFNSRNQFSSKTLILYSDNSFYIGSMINKGYQMPKASGKGLLISPNFIYQGQFSNGLPEGYGIYRTKTMEFIGAFQNGEPNGDAIERSVNGLFIGEVKRDRRKGKLITPQNIEKQPKNNYFWRQQEELKFVLKKVYSHKKIHVKQF